MTGVQTCALPIWPHTTGGGVGGVESSTVMKKPNGCTIFDKDPELLLSSEEETDGEFDRQGEEEQSQIEMGGKKMEEKHESEEDKWLKEDIVQPRKPKVNKFKTFFQKFIPGF